MAQARTVSAADQLRCRDLGEAFFHFIRGATLRAVWPIPLAVGTFLAVLHQGSVIVAGEATTVTWVKIAISYLVPYCVSSAGYLQACRLRAISKDEVA